MYLARGTSAEPGKFRSNRLPYQRAMMDDLCVMPTDDQVPTRVVWQMAAQVGKTLSAVAGVMYYIQHDPSEQLVVMPTLDGAKKFAKLKVQPCINDTPIMHGLIKDPRIRDSGNTQLEKQYPGGTITYVGANSTAGLRSVSKRICIMDELDNYYDGPEGDPVDLAITRTETFHDSVILMSSTPTLKGHSKIEKAFQEGDQQYWHVPCHECGEYQTLTWRQVKWDKNDEQNAWYECEHCNAHWTDRDRIRNIHAGEWRATAPFTGVRSRHLSGLYKLMGKKQGYSSHLHEMVVNFKKAKEKGRAGIISWCNLFLAETYEEETERVSSNALMDRRETYGIEVPEKALVLTAGADLQQDRIEYEVVGWSEGYESWGVEYGVVHGSPLLPGTWSELNERLVNRQFIGKDGLKFRVQRCFIDIGGSKGFDDAGYAFCKPRLSLGVFPIRGSNIRSAPAVPARPSRNNKARVPVYRLGVDDLKRQLLSYMKVKEDGPGRMHWSDDPARGYDEAYFSMLTAEELKVRMRNGFRYTEWVKIRERNEALDIRCYASAAAQSLNINWKKLRVSIEGKDVEEDEDQEPDPQPQFNPQPQPTRRVRRTRGTRSTWASNI